jgi:short-subunit dehydrogenase
MTREFEQKVAVITGASSGIGKAVASSLARLGARVCLVARDGARLGSVCTELAHEAGAVTAFPCDLASPAEVERLAASLRTSYDGIDLLVHSAGTFQRASLADVPTDEAAEVMQVNLLAPMDLNRRMLPALRKSRGQVVFINSTIVSGVRAGWGAYAASKQGLKAIADALRDEVNPDGIRVLSIYVGRTATPMQKEILAMEGRAWEPEKLLQPEDVASALVSCISLPRTAEVTELWIRPMMKV